MYGKNPQHQCGQAQKETLPDDVGALGMRHKYVSQPNMSHTQLRTN